MRHLRSDVSHRMRRRPSIFTARWFRLLLGGGAAVVLALWGGPMVAGWLRAQPSRPPGATSRPALLPPSPAASTVVAAAPRVAPSAELPAATPPVAPRSARAPAGPPPKPPEDPATRAAGAPAGSPAPSGAAPGVGPAVFRVQVGAFLDHRNADRLTERLRSEGVEVVTGLVEESRTLYRVLATPDGEGYPALVQRLGALGHTAEPAGEGAAVDRPVSLRAAVETTRQLREQGIRVQLERAPSSAAFRVVRVGAYATAEEAERARADLAARGYEGLVVRER